jgi:choline dehydrogenase-like flavoprotein
VEDADSIVRAGLLYGGTGYHASGACAMGPSDVDPLDARLRVRGTTGLRVVDVSIMPAMVSGNLNGPIMAMAWRAAEMILADA